jgi:hypothetical protein
MFSKLFGRKKKSQRPTSIFRYRSINTWVEPIILTNELFFSARRNLNDPNESRWRFNTLVTDEKIKRFYRVMLNNPGFYKQTLDQAQQSGDPLLYLALKSGPESPYFKYVINKAHLNMGENIDKLKSIHERMIDVETGICCFSESGDNVKMFAHYADSQRGCCIEFGERSEMLRHINPVVYTDDIPTIDVWEINPIAIMAATLLCKSKEWAEEREWRMIRYPKGQGSFKLDLDIKSITFGCYTKEDDKEYILSLLSRRDPSLGNIELFQAHQNPDSYRLERLPLKSA